MIDLPPEEFFFWELELTSEIQSNGYVVILSYTLNFTPKQNLIKLLCFEKLLNSQSNFQSKRIIRGKNIIVESRLKKIILIIILNF